MKKLLILITAYNVEKFIEKVINRIPHEKIKKDYLYKLLIIDDKSQDKTREIIIKLKNTFKDIDIDYLFNQKNQGYGGNQKIGYHYAIKYDFDYVVLVHGDGQYAPEKIPDILEEFSKYDCDAVQGSRMIYRFNAIKGGMPIYKFFGNIGLTFIQNVLTGLKMSEFHSGYRAYKVKTLKQIPFKLNSNQFHFDTEIFLQLSLINKKINEIPIPTFYGDEISSLNSIKYGFAILRTTMIFFFQKFSIFYDRKYDRKNFIIDDQNNFQYTKKTNYVSKLHFLSTHSKSIEIIKKNSRILSLGCGEAFIEKFLKKEKNCNIFGVDNFDNPGIRELNKYQIADLNNYKFDFQAIDYDYVVFLDVIEHLSNPEDFLEKLSKKMAQNPECKLIISTPNVANIFIRLMLFFGSFNYGKRGILDKTHTRLFTQKTFTKILEESDFKIKKISYIPIPVPLIVQSKLINSFVMLFQKILNKINGKLFCFQFLIEAEAYPDLDYLIKKNKI